MHEEMLRGWIGAVKTGRMSRRTFLQKAVAAGLAGPIAAQMLLSKGIAQTQGAFKYEPTKRGGGGALRLLWWQAPTLLNPHFATGNKDQDACRVFYEPLASWDEEGNLIPVLAAEIPSRDNGGIAADGSH